MNYDDNNYTMDMVVDNNNLEQQQQHHFHQNENEFETEIGNDQTETRSMLANVTDEENLAIDIHNDKEPLTAYELLAGQTSSVAATSTTATILSSTSITTSGNSFVANCNSIDR